MSELPAASALLRRSAMPALCLCLMAYFGSHALVGDSGLTAWPAIAKEHDELAAAAERVARRKAELEHKVALLDPRGVDPDYADELVRSNLGVVRPDEVIVPLTGPGRAD